MLQTTMTSLKAKKNSKKGFTLMEMLIVVAIIAILVAIAVPVFTSSLNKAKLATDDANFRAAIAASAAAYLQSQDGTTNAAAGMYYAKDGTWTDDKDVAYVAQVAQTDSNPSAKYNHTAKQIIQANIDGSAGWVDNK